MGNGTHSLFCNGTFNVSRESASYKKVGNITTWTLLLRGKNRSAEDTGRGEGR